MQNTTQKVPITYSVNCKYLPVISMISLTFLLVAVIFTYRVIELGPFLTPGGVIPFSITYILGSIITETYGYKNAKTTIFGNFLCIFLFSLCIHLILKIPAPLSITHETAFSIVFDSAMFVTAVYSFGFLFGDLINAYCVSKWHALLKGRLFIARLIGATIIGQVSFSLIVIPSLYMGSFSIHRLLHQFFATIAAKILIICLLAYPGAVIVQLLRKLEGINNNEPIIKFNPFEKETI